MWFDLLMCRKRLAVLVRACLLALASLALASASGCSSVPTHFVMNEVQLADRLGSDAFADDPGFRICCVFGYELKPIVPFVWIGDTIDLSRLPGHAYGSDLLENNGLVYTRRGGFIDMGHLRDYVDWTAHLAHLLRAAFDARRPVELPLHGATRAEVWLTPNGRPVDDELIVRLAERIAFEFSIWHEIATWYGWSEVSIYPERVSAFNPEDLYSNLLGAHIGGAALRRSLAAPGDLCAAFERAVDEELTQLIGALLPVSRETTRRALDAVEGPDAWWRQDLWVHDFRQVPRRHLDFDGRTSPPWLLPVDFPAAPADVPFLVELPSRTPSGEALSSWYALEIEVDREVITEMPLPASGVVDGPGLLAALEPIRRQVREVFGPLGDSPTLWTSARAEPDRRVTFARADSGVWHLRFSTREGDAWRVIQRVSFKDHAQLRTYLDSGGVAPKRIDEPR